MWELIRCEPPREWMKQAASLSYAELLGEHYTDYAALFGRTQLELNPDQKGGMTLPTPRRLERYRTGAPDYSLESLYYQFGRYLLIASSRPGNLPANLQGMWHNNVDGPWRVDYHNNINVQMNYWPACPTNLSECEQPLIDFIRMQVKPGKERHGLISVHGDGPLPFLPIYLDSRLLCVTRICHGTFHRWPVPGWQLMCGIIMTTHAIWNSCAR